MHLDHWSQVARSLNTLGIIERYEGSYSTAIQLSEAALRVFKAADHELGQGLALTALANTYQRLAYKFDDENMIELENKIGFYRDAIERSKEAVDIYRKIGAPESMADALKEFSCACRNLVYFKRKYPTLIGEELEELKETSLCALREGLGLVQNDPYRQLEAQINMAYLGFYAEDEDLYTLSIKNADQLIPDEYSLKDGLSSDDQHMQKFWTQLGKLYMLKGRLYIVCWGFYCSN